MTSKEEYINKINYRIVRLNGLTPGQVARALGFKNQEEHKEYMRKLITEEIKPWEQ